MTRIITGKQTQLPKTIRDEGYQYISKSEHVFIVTSYGN